MCIRDRHIVVHDLLGFFVIRRAFFFREHLNAFVQRFIQRRIVILGQIQRAFAVYAVADRGNIRALTAGA